MEIISGFCFAGVEEIYRIRADSGKNLCERSKEMKKLTPFERWLLLAFCGLAIFLNVLSYWWPSSERRDPVAESICRVIEATGIVAGGAAILDIPVKERLKAEETSATSGHHWTVSSVARKSRGGKIIEIKLNFRRNNFKEKAYGEFDRTHPEWKKLQKIEILDTVWLETTPDGKIISIDPDK